MAKHNLNQIAKEIEHEAYARGYNDAINLIINAAKMALKRPLDGYSAASVGGAVRRPKTGSPGDKILIYVSKNPESTTDDIVEGVNNAGANLRKKSIEHELTRLTGRFLEKRGERWYSVS